MLTIILEISYGVVILPSLVWLMLSGVLFAFLSDYGLQVLNYQVENKVYLLRLLGVAYSHKPWFVHES